MSGSHNIRVSNLCLADDICIPIAFDGDTEAAEYLVRTILSRDDISVEKVETQKRTGSIASRSAVQDILAHDSNGNLIDIEIQRAFHGCEVTMRILMKIYKNYICII